METKILIGIVVVLLVTAAFLYTLPMPTAEIETARTMNSGRVSVSTANSGTSTKAVIEGTVPIGGSTMTTAEVL